MKKTKETREKMNYVGVLSYAILKVFDARRMVGPDRERFFFYERSIRSLYQILLPSLRPPKNIWREYSEKMRRFQSNKVDFAAKGEDRARHGIMLLDHILDEILAELEKSKILLRSGDVYLGEAEA